MPNQYVPRVLPLVLLPFSSRVRPKSSKALKMVSSRCSGLVDLGNSSSIDQHSMEVLAGLRCPQCHRRRFDLSVCSGNQDDPSYVLRPHSSASNVVAVEEIAALFGDGEDVVMHLKDVSLAKERIVKEEF